MWIRHVLVPGITDKDEYLIKTREFIDTLDTVMKVEVLPYQTLGEYKWKELGIPYKLEGVEPPSEERIPGSSWEPRKWTRPYKYSCRISEKELIPDTTKVYSTAISGFRGLKYKVAG